MQRWLFLLVFLITAQASTAQDSMVVVNEITFEGNKRTKERMITREMYIKSGDTLHISEVNDKVERSRNMIFNTALFNSVDLKLSYPDSSTLNVHVVVEERWYTFPIPIFELIDRNFNVWWEEMGGDLSRTNYGMRFYQENVRGRNERLKIVAQFGWTQELAFSYKFPFFDKEQTHGVRFTTEYKRNKEVWMTAVDNKHIFYEDQDFAREQFKAAALFSRRKSINTTHYLELSYNSASISDSLAINNPDYLLRGRTNVQYAYASYELQIERRNIKAYPTKGHYFDARLIRHGLGIFQEIDQTELILEYSQYWELSKRLFAATKLKTKIGGPQRQSYLTQRGLGFGEDLVRGYELYVIDGQQYGLSRTALKWEALFFSIKKIPLIKVKGFQSIPFHFYPKLFVDLGYINDDFYTQGNDFYDEFLVGYGVGLDIWSWYDVVFRVEYSFNNLGENGLYLHSGIGI